MPPASINYLDARYGLFWLWGVNTLPAYALVPDVSSASAGMVLAVLDRQHVLLF